MVQRSGVTNDDRVEQLSQAQETRERKTDSPKICYD